MAKRRQEKSEKVGRRGAPGASWGEKSEKNSRVGVGPADARGALAMPVPGQDGSDLPVLYHALSPGWAGGLPTPAAVTAGPYVSAYWQK